MRLGKSNSLRFSTLILCLLIGTATLAACTGSGGSGGTGQKQAPEGGGLAQPDASFPTAQDFEDAFDEFIGLKPKGKPKVFTKVTEVFPASPETKQLSAAANAAGWSWGGGLEFTAPNISVAEAHALAFSDANGAQKVATAWTKQAESIFTTIKTKPIRGSLSDGTAYSGFTVSLLDGNQETFMVAPVDNVLLQMVVVGSPDIADEAHTADWLSTLEQAVM